MVCYCFRVFRALMMNVRWLSAERSKACNFHNTVSPLECCKAKAVCNRDVLHSAWCLPKWVQILYSSVMKRIYYS